jgi:hypothetical protein
VSVSVIESMRGIEHRITWLAMDVQASLSGPCYDPELEAVLCCLAVLMAKPVLQGVIAAWHGKGYMEVWCGRKFTNGSW